MRVTLEFENRKSRSRVLSLLDAILHAGVTVIACTKGDLLLT